MATIDPNIAMGYKPVQIENPLNQMAAYSQIQRGQQEQQMNALQMQKAQQELNTQNRLGKAYAGATNRVTGEIDYNRLLGALAEDESSATAIPSVIKSKKDAELAAQQLKTQQSTETKNITETKNAALKNIREKTSDLQFNPSDDNVRAHAQDAILHGVWTQAQADQNTAEALAVPIAQRPAYFAQKGLDAEKRVTTTETARTNAEREKNARLQTGISQGNLTLAQQKDVRDRELAERRDIVASTSTAADGTVTQFNKFGDVINRITAAGKPSATFEKTAALQKQQAKDLKMAITEIEKAIEPSGLLEKSTGSGAGRAFDVTAGFFGYAPPGAIAAASLKPIADLGLKMIPRFEGPQSDKDTASYKQAAGELANDSLPVAIRLAAAKTVVRLMKTRTGQFVNETMATEGLPAGGPALPAGFTVDKP